jgi:hypothetical protein
MTASFFISTSHLEHQTRQIFRGVGGRAIRVLLILQGLVVFARADLSTQELQQLVNGSTFTFIGTIKEVGNSNVSGFDSKDFPMIVQVDSVEPSDQQALKKLGDLRGSRLTVAVNPISRIGLQNNVSAVFFADPLVYEKHIGVIATAVPIPDSKEDFIRRLQAAAVRKSEVPLRTEIGNAELIVTGEVVAVKALASNKAVDLGSIHNGWELFSEHRPRWKEAIIKVAQRIDKPEPRPDFVSVVFPTTHDCFFGPSPKFQVKDSGIWLLHRNQLDKQETDVLILKSDEYKGNNVQSYTALAAADFQDISMLIKIQQIIGKTR